MSKSEQESCPIVGPNRATLLAHYGEKVQIERAGDETVRVELPHPGDPKLGARLTIKHSDVDMLPAAIDV